MNRALAAEYQWIWEPTNKFSLWNHTHTEKFDTYQNLGCPVSTTEKNRPPFLLDKEEENLVGKTYVFHRD